MVTKMDNFIRRCWGLMTVKLTQTGNNVCNNMTLIILYTHCTGYNGS